MSEVLDAPQTAATAADPAPPPAAGAAPQDWRASLPPDIRDAPTMGRFDAPEKLAKSYLELESLVGRKGLIPPTDKDGPEVHARFRAALGVPEKPEGYDLKAPEGLPDGLWSDDAAQGYAALAHKHGLTPAQAQGLAAEFMAMQAQAMPNPGEAMKAAETTLRQEWGAAYGAKVEHANRALRQFGGEDLVDLMAATGLGNDPRVVKMMAAIGEAMAEDTPAGMGQGRSGVLTPNEAREEITRIMGDREGAYWNKRDPAHAATVARVTSLHEMAAAGR